MITGCVKCTDDNICNRFILGQETCEYNTTCLNCDTSQGFTLDKKGNCCKVENCEICSSTSNTKCQRCKKHFTLLKSQHVMDEEIIGDQCQTINACNKTYKSEDSGFVSIETFHDPLILIKGAVLRSDMT